MTSISVLEMQLLQAVEALIADYGYSSESLSGFLEDNAKGWEPVE